jgi:hypothetical protein
LQQIEEAIIEDSPIGRCVEAYCRVAVALRQAAGGRPSGVETVDVIQGVDLLDDSRHIVVHIESVAPVEVGTPAGYDAHAVLFCGSSAFAEEVAVVRELSVAVEGEDAGHADKDDVAACGVSVVSPTLRCS